jgi:acetoin utilization deacetylase AcuC-like enzyme
MPVPTRRTGIFFYYQTGERLRDFPGALEGILNRENIFFYDAYYPSKPRSSFELETLSPEVLYHVHSPEMVEAVRRTGDFEGALLSAAATVRAAEKIWSGEIDNAFVFTGFGDHHAGRTFFGGGCYCNGAALAIDNLRSRFGARRFAIVDTDAHHGDGTWDIFEADEEVLYVCFCENPYLEKNNKVNIEVPVKVTDAEYLKLVKEAFFHRAQAFQPEMLFWNWGFDGTRGEYGDIGLTPDSHRMLASALKAMADDVCQGRFVVVLCGGSRRDLASRLCPSIIKALAGGDD